jgi:hypothetical protein
MVNPATVSDLEARWLRPKPLTESERRVAQEYLDDAWEAILLPRRLTLPAQMLAGEVAERTVRRVLCAMVLRVFMNPEGKSEESIDDYRYRRDAAVASGELYVSDGELADVTPIASRAKSRSVRLVAYGDL